jgi:hypothetical protein
MEQCKKYQKWAYLGYGHGCLDTRFVRTANYGTHGQIKK